MRLQIHVHPGWQSQGITTRYPLPIVHPPENAQKTQPSAYPSEAGIQSASFRVLFFHPQRVISDTLLQLRMQCQHTEHVSG